MCNVTLAFKGPDGRCSVSNLDAKTKRWLRVGALVALLAALFTVGMASGVTQQLTVESLRDTMSGAGVWGLLLFLGAFAVATLIQLPGMLFVAAGALAYGQGLGIVVGLIGALASVMVSFYVVRSVGGKLLTEIDKPLMRKLLARLDKRPVRTIALLRTVFWVAPPLNYALALSNVSRRAYFWGSAIGLVAPITAACLFVETLV